MRLDFVIHEYSQDFQQLNFCKVMQVLHGRDFDLIVSLRLMLLSVLFIDDGYHLCAERFVLLMGCPTE